VKGRASDPFAGPLRRLSGGSPALGRAAAEDFALIDDRAARCRQGKILTGSGKRYPHNRGAQVLQYEAKDADCRTLRRARAGRSVASGGR
jgi:hypothetical protein